VRLQEQPFQLLTVLVERNGEIVTREELRQHLWPGDTFVDFDKSLGVAVTKLRDALEDNAANPTFIETVSRHGYRFIAPVEREHKHASTLVTPGAFPETIAPSAKRKSAWPSRTILIGAGCLVVVATAMAYYARGNRRRESPPADSLNSPATASHAAVRRSIAVLGFRDLQGRPENSWLSAALSEMLSTELASTSQCRLVSGEDIARAKRELPLADVDTLSRGTLLRLRTNPGADVVVLGSYAVLPENGEDLLRLDLRMQDTASGETIGEEAFTGNEENLFELASKVGTSMRKTLGMNPNPSGIADPSRASLPSNQTALRLYTEGRAKLWAFDLVGARDLLRKAIAVDPEFPLAHAALSQALWHLDYGVQARTEAQRALELSQNLQQEERLVVEGQYRMTIRDWPKAAESYHALFKLFPDSLDYGLLLAGAQLHVNPSDARQTLATLRRLPFPADEDARIDLMEASAWIDADFPKAQAAAENAIVKGKAQGSTFIIDRAYGILCQQADSIGASANGIHYCEQAVRNSAAGGLLSEARNLNDLAGQYFELGDVVRAEAIWRQANQRFQKSDDAEGVAATLSNIGEALLAQGDLEQAQKHLAESIPSYQTNGDRDGVALVLNDHAEILRLQGNLEAARVTYQQAEVTAKEIDDKSRLAYVLSGLGDVLKDRGDLGAARRSYEQSLALRSGMGEKQAEEESRVSLAQISVEEGHPADAETELRNCKEQFHQTQQADDELVAASGLINALLAQGKQADAKQESASAKSLAAKSQNVLSRLQFDLASGRAVLASDTPKPSRLQLENILRQAHARELVGIELEARLSLAEFEKKVGHTSSAQSQLASLEHDAQMKGFGLVARKAAEIH